LSVQNERDVDKAANGPRFSPAALGVQLTGFGISRVEKKPRRLTEPTGLILIGKGDFG